MNRRSRFGLWLFVCSSFCAVACQDRPLDLLSGRPENEVAGGMAESGADSGGSLGGGAGDGAAQSTGGAGTAPAAGAAQGGATFGGAGNAGTSAGSGGASAGSGGASAGSGGASAVAGKLETGGVQSCASDADCAPPRPACSTTAHVCKQCNKSSQCPNGQQCSTDDGECGS